MNARSCTRAAVAATHSREPDALAEIGRSLAAKSRELSARPHPDKCDFLLRDLTEAYNLVSRMRDQMLRDRQPV